MAGKSLGKSANSVQGFGQVEQNEIYLENWSKVVSLYKAHDKLTMTCAFDWIHFSTFCYICLRPGIICSTYTVHSHDQSYKHTYILCIVRV